MPKPTVKVTPMGAGHRTYMDDRLGIPEKDLEGLIDGAVETRFAGGCDLEEGCSGRLMIDTTYENFSEGESMDVVRSDVTRYDDHPAPVEVDRHKYPHRGY